MIYLYAIVDADPPCWPGLFGLQNAQVGFLEQEKLRVAVSEWNSNPSANRLQPDTIDIWIHEGVVESLMDNRGVLPARFGTLLPDAEAIQAILADNAASFRRDLERVRGCCETSLTVLWTDALAEDFSHRTENQMAFTNGRAYLNARLQKERQDRARCRSGKALATELLDVLQPHLVAACPVFLPAPRLLLQAAFLIPAGRLADFQQTVSDLQAQHTELKFLCTGPWPAYNFVSPIPDSSVRLLESLLTNVHEYNL